MTNERNANAQAIVTKKQVFVEGYAPKKVFIDEKGVQRLRNQLNDPRVVVGVQQLGILEEGDEFMLLKIFIPKAVLDDENYKLPQTRNEKVYGRKKDLESQY